MFNTVGQYRWIADGTPNDPTYSNSPFYDWRTIWLPLISQWVLQVQVASGIGHQWINVEPTDLTFQR